MIVLYFGDVEKIIIYNFAQVMKKLDVNSEDDICNSAITIKEISNAISILIRGS